MPNRPLMVPGSKIRNECSTGVARNARNDPKVVDLHLRQWIQGLACIQQDAHPVECIHPKLYNTQA